MESSIQSISHIPTNSPAKAFHGGAFFDEIGSDFQSLENRNRVINADVLDAWYDPSPKVVEAISKNLEWLIKTSPPTHGEGLVDQITESRGIHRDNLLIGSGSSSIIYLALPQLLTKEDQVTILEPTYGEYAHILENVIGCTVKRCTLNWEDGFQVHLNSLLESSRGSKMVILVNPNSPNGLAMDKTLIQDFLQKKEEGTTLLVDETYIDFLGIDPLSPRTASLEVEAVTNEKVIVLKSMSKFYSLSGLRIGYMVASKKLIEHLSPLSPPWNVGLIAQIAGVEALRDRTYYLKMAFITSQLREGLATRLAKIQGVLVMPSETNFLLMRLDQSIAQSVVEKMAESGVFLRNCDSLSRNFNGQFVRTAVKTEPENDQIFTHLESTVKEFRNV